MFWGHLESVFILYTETSFEGWTDHTSSWFTKLKSFLNPNPKLLGPFINPTALGLPRWCSVLSSDLSVSSGTVSPRYPGTPCHSVSFQGPFTSLCPHMMLPSFWGAFLVLVSYCRRVLFSRHYSRNTLAMALLLSHRNVLDHSLEHRGTLPHLCLLSSE
jgi:hypothetical protein